MKRSIVGAFLVVLGVAGCNSDPLVGTWLAQATGVSAQLDFRADGTVEDQALILDQDTGCATSGVLRETWSDDGKLLTLSPTSLTLSVSGCADPSGDEAPHTDDLRGADPEILRYTITGDELTLTSSSRTAHYFRQ